MIETLTASEYFQFIEKNQEIRDFLEDRARKYLNGVSERIMGTFKELVFDTTTILGLPLGLRENPNYFYSRYIDIPEIITSRVTAYNYTTEYYSGGDTNIFDYGIPLSALWYLEDTIKIALENKVRIEKWETSYRVQIAQKNVEESRFKRQHQYEALKKEFGE